MISEPAAHGDPWTQQLTHAFEALLERPLSSYDPTATYAAYFGGNWFGEGEFDRADAWVNRGSTRANPGSKSTTTCPIYRPRPPKTW